MVGDGRCERQGSSARYRRSATGVQGGGHLVTVLSVSGLKIVPTQAVYAGTKNAVRTLLESLRQESTDGVLRTTSISPGLVRTEFIDHAIDDPALHEHVTQNMADLGIVGGRGIRLVRQYPVRTHACPAADRGAVRECYS
ncbi:putative oxidoreductase [Nocardia gamkensis]|uniref:SDR family NAD(P)-dependent oxidoreductase n=1 Tax=Nocardia gamkensis TaxID=352869 RepID=UPI000A4560A2|nr:putative oxidoreductase [Nocardia gamkensis]